MCERKKQVEKLEERHEFFEVSRERFDNFIEQLGFFKITTIEYNQVVYFRLAPQGRVVAKNDYGNRTLYLAKLD